MPDELITRLRAALDTAEHLARAAFEGSGWATGAPYTGEWSASAGAVEDSSGQVIVYDEGAPNEAQAEHIAAWGPARILSLVARDRALLAAFVRAEGYVAEHVDQCGAGLCSCQEYLTWTATAGALRMVVERAAEFWLGSTE